MNNLKEWWNQASSKDQLYLVVGGFCLAAYILFMGVYKPVTDMRDKQLERNHALNGSLERVKDMAAKWKKINRSGDSRRGPSLDSTVQRSLSKNGIRASGMDASGKNGLRIRVENASFESALAWMYELEIGQGLIIKDVSVAAGSDPGTVSINLRLLKD